MTKRILVTGGAGFIGSNFVNYIARHYPEYYITVFDKLTYAGNRNSLPESFFARGNKQYIFTEACVTDRDKVSKAIINSDIVIHFAAESHVSNSLAQADEFVATNVFGTMVLCEEIIKYPVKKFILISSSETYGTALQKPMDENHLLNPASPYAASKAGGDRIAYSYYTSFRIPLIILRPFNQYGPYQHIEKVIPKFITSLLQGKDILLENSGVQTRDWLFVEDLCRAIDKVLHLEKTDIFGEVINIGSGKETSILTIATKIARLLDKNRDECFQYGRDRMGQVMSHMASMKKAKEILNWEPSIDIDKGLKITVEWYKKNRPWWSKLKFPVLKINEG